MQVDIHTLFHWLQVLIVVIPVYLVGRIFWIIIRKACLEDRVRRRARVSHALLAGPVC
jgi:hypothetical protein